MAGRKAQLCPLHKQRSRAVNCWFKCRRSVWSPFKPGGDCGQPFPSLTPSFSFKIRCLGEWFLKSFHHELLVKCDLLEGSAGRQTLTESWSRSAKIWRESNMAGERSCCPVSCTHPSSSLGKDNPSIPAPMSQCEDTEAIPLRSGGVTVNPQGPFPSKRVELAV